MKQNQALHSALFSAKPYKCFSTYLSLVIQEGTKKWKKMITDLIKYMRDILSTQFTFLDSLYGRKSYEEKLNHKRRSEVEFLIYLTCDRVIRLKSFDTIYFESNGEIDDFILSYVISSKKLIFQSFNFFGNVLNWDFTLH